MRFVAFRKRLNFDNINEVRKYCNYGGILKFNIKGKDICDNGVINEGVIRVSSQIIEESDGWRYCPTARFELSKRKIVH